MKEENIKYTHRYLARIILEATTPLFVGSGSTSLINDALAQKDHHGFPMIQGTSLMGVLRHALEDYTKEKERWNRFFGYQSYKESKVGLGSKVRISSAYLLLPDGKIAEGLVLNTKNQALLKKFETLPSRQHVRITDKGVAEENGLFENEVVPKGCQFIFELEVRGDEKSGNDWEELLKQLYSPLFRIGQGTRNGYGELKVLECRKRVFNLKNNEEDFVAYLNYNSSFNQTNDCLGKPPKEKNEEVTDKKQECTLPDKDQNFITYHLNLAPDQSFFIFGSGFGDDEVDNTPLKEPVILYQPDDLLFEEHTVIPATSIKGAISHRTCFHYNKLIGNKITEQMIQAKRTNFEEFLGAKNDAVYELFGAEAGNKDKDKTKPGKRGIVLLNDFHFKDNNQAKIFNHVAIDRFTGGAIDGALFSEKVSQKESLAFCVYVHREYDEKDLIIKAFETALMDICKGLLSLGGMTTKGHGIFTGTLFRDNNKIYAYDK